MTTKTSKTLRKISQKTKHGFRAQKNIYVKDYKQVQCTWFILFIGAGY